MWTNKKGISPIVGVILVVAMTVLLAAIAWTYMGGFTTTTPKSYLVSAKASENASGWITITYTGGPNHAQVKYLNVSVSVGNKVYSIWCGEIKDTNDNTIYTFFVSNGAETYGFSKKDGQLYGITDGKLNSSKKATDSSDDIFKNEYIMVSPIDGLGYGEDHPPKIGTAILIRGTEGPDNNHVTVSATFTDGTTQTILDVWV